MADNEPMLFGLKNNIGSSASCDTWLDLQEHAKKARELFNTIQDELEHREEGLKDGLSFLDMKNDTLLSYMIDICNIVIRKVRGETIEGHKSVERCVEYRVILEKIKAIDQKLAYQLNKLITLPENAEPEPNERINVSNLDVDIKTDSDVSGSEGEDEDEDEGEDEVEVEKPGMYKPPKLRSVAYSEEGKRKKYDDFYGDEEPVEKNMGEDEERRRFEEENYTRLPDRKKKRPKLSRRRRRA